MSLTASPILVITAITVCVVLAVMKYRAGQQTKRPKGVKKLIFNCARVYVGGYVGGGTNEDERWMDCNYELLEGDITIKRLRPIRVRGTDSDGTLFTLQSLVLYPKTDTATVTVTNGKRIFQIKLVKAHTRRSNMFKLRL